MTSFNCFILALFSALMFSVIDVDLAARRLQQLPPLPKIGLPPLPQPTIPTVLKPGSLPPLPSILNLPSAPKAEAMVAALFLAKAVTAEDDELLDRHQWWKTSMLENINAANKAKIKQLKDAISSKF
ncbi:hypothetical protein V6N11_075218 [Hibiscus sabdariffa]|uniref:Uncharacterized protein n=1 Tax=Hibiscus sabdariffa TaxID=183260 RepID=A0ABR2R5Z5_9ROSI